MIILAIDTSCDETCAAVTDGVNILSNIVWSQASLHAKWGGVFPSLAQRMHRERIDWVVEKALKKSQIPISNIQYIAVTVGPGLAIALGVGIDKAKELSQKYKLPVIPVNHVESHLFSALAENRISNSKFQISNYQFPALGIVASGGTSQVIFVKSIGDYEILAETMDDALGEALDKGARALGFGYPGGPILEKIAKDGIVDKKLFPVPMMGREELLKFSYSGLKTALVRKIMELEKSNKLNRITITNLAASYQYTAFEHFVRITQKAIKQLSISYKPGVIFVGGGVGANVAFRKRLRKLAKENNMKIYFPYSKKLYTDNAGMVGITAYLRMKEYKNLGNKERRNSFQSVEISNPQGFTTRRTYSPEEKIEKLKYELSVISHRHLDKIDRKPDLKI